MITSMKSWQNYKETKSEVSIVNPLSGQADTFLISVNNNVNTCMPGL